MARLRLVASLVALSTAALTAACQPGGSEQANGSAAASGGTTLTLYTALMESEWRVLREQVFPPFEKAHHCHINAVNVESADMVKKLYALKAGGHMDVDVFGQDNMLLAPLVQEGLVEDLTPYRSRIPQQTIPSLIGVGEFSGHLYFMPYRPNVEITFYNKDYLDKYGLKPPMDWDQLFQTARTLYEREGIGRVCLKADGQAGTTVQLFDWMNEAGGNPLKLNDAGCVAAYTYLQKIWPYVSPEARRADFNTMNQFLAMDAAYIGQNWPTAVDVIVRQGEKTNVLAYHGWRGPVREAHTLGGEVFGIPKGAPHKDLALDYVSYIESRPVQQLVVSKLAWPAMRSDAYGEVEPWARPYFTAVNEALGKAIPRPNIPYWEDFDKAVNAAFRETVIEGKAVQPVLDKYAAMLDEARKRKGS